MKYLKKLAGLITIFFLTLPLTQNAVEVINKNTSRIDLQSGDLFFQEGESNPFTEAVKAVTYGYKGAKLSHVGMLVESGNKYYILEAFDKVELTPLNKFLNRSVDTNKIPKVLIGRLKKKYKELIPEAIKIGLTLVNLPYNYTFNINNNKSFYCSQLIYYCFKKANNNNPVFTLSPMTFKNKKKKEYFPVWIDYFKKLNVPIPEGNPGLNPGSMSRSKKIDIIYVLGNISGMKSK